MHDLLARYDDLIARDEIKPDDMQQKAVLTLNGLYRDLAQKKNFLSGLIKRQPVKGSSGVYLYGGVGRGKSMLMDLFFDALPDTIPKRRVHLHEFMIETHDWLHTQRTSGEVDNLLPSYAKYLSSHVRVLCFDEFHVTDVADAMILSRLFTALFEAGMVVIATSNWPPDKLYEGGLQRVRFMPFIDLVKTQMVIVYLDSPIDYRRAAVQDMETYLYPLNLTTQNTIDRFFTTLSHGKEITHKTISVKGRDINIRAAGKIARASFSQLCEQPHSAEDYLAIARAFDVIFLEHVPKMGYDRKNEVKRLMTLIDVVYDARRRMIISAEAAPEKIYYGPDYAFEFDRTISRIKEMQSSSYQAEQSA
jgi:cell division protein ZapE